MAIRSRVKVMRVRILKVKDNQLKKKDVFSEIANLTSKIADKTLEQLEREGIFVFPELVKDADDITRDQMILQGLNDCFRTGNVMGFLGYGAERLVIESRCGGDDEDYFLQYLLDRVLDFPNIVDLATDRTRHARRAFHSRLTLHSARGCKPFSEESSSDICR